MQVSFHPQQPEVTVFSYMGVPQTTNQSLI
uniref:Uncharacterized protein n=1 Tax=Rhizophora mucronata TaxID=61149 RepID=A0A2P2JNY7_RHIMU